MSFSSFFRYLLLICTLGFFSTNVQAMTPDCSSPELAVKTLLRNLHDNNWNRTDAAACIQHNEKSALQLKQILDAKGIYIDYSKIPNDPNYQNLNGDEIAIIDSRLPEIQFTKKDGQWQISDSSLTNIQDLYNKTFSNHVRSFLKILPAFFFENFFGIALWQYSLFLLLLLLAWGVGRLTDKLISSQIIHFFEKQQFKIDSSHILPLRRPIVWMVIPLIFLGTLTDLQLPVRISQILFFFTRFALSVAAVVLCSRIVDLLSSVFLSKAEKTESKLDDQLIPLVTRGSKTIIWLFGALFILQNMGVEVTALVAFGSVGGVAIALASKDTVENLFGSLVVFIDQPFQIGEYVLIDGSIEGTVEEVGFRSTRIRTLDKTLISVPNAKIAHCTVNNFAKRTHRRFSSTFTLRYDTTPEQMEAFVEWLKVHLKETEIVDENTIVVGFSEMNSFSLDVLTVCYINSNQMSDLLIFKQNLFLTIMRKTREMGIGFAFPTTTIELEDQHK